jgi:dihydrofolate reductase
MLISLVVAASSNHAIGKDNRLLWHLPNDMKFFKNTTWAMPVLMGRKTFASLNNRPLNGRLNIVITRGGDIHVDGVLTAHSLEEAVSIAQEKNYKECFVIGGGDIYRQALPVADKVYLTRVDAVIEGDTFFPVLDPAEWEMTWEEAHLPDAKHAYGYRFQLWEKKKA